MWNPITFPMARFDAGGGINALLALSGLTNQIAVAAGSTDCAESR
jgi:hypothetical protein